MPPEERQQLEQAGVTVTQTPRRSRGVSFTKVASDGGAGGDPMQAMAMNMLFGPEGQTQYVAALDGTYMTVSGLSDDQIAKVIAAAREGDAPLLSAPGVDQVGDKLPGERSACCSSTAGRSPRAG